MEKNPPKRLPSAKIYAKIGRERRDGSPFPPVPPTVVSVFVAHMNLNSREGRREQGLRIQKAVEAAGLSIEELAQRIGCSRALIYQYLSGSTLAQPDRLQRIAGECGVPLELFYSEDPPASPPPSVPLPAQPLPLSVSYDLLSDLADAQEAPPDYRALASTCERLLAFAAQQNDPSAMVEALKRLGNARYFLADYPRAAEALTRAAALAEEIGDGSTASAARQTLGGAYLGMGRISEARKQFLQIAENPSRRSRWKGIVSLGSILEMQGFYREAMQKFDDASSLIEEAEAAGEMSSESVTYARLYIDGNRRYVYMDGGDFAEARRLAESCGDIAEAIGNADQHLEARFDRAWCDFHTGAWAEAYGGWKSALQLARFVGDANRETLCRAWLGIFSAAAGSFEAAIEYGKDALSAALSRGDRRAEFYAQLALSDAYLGSGERGAEARYHINQALAIATALKHERDEIECRLRLARLAFSEEEWGDGEEAASRALVLALRLGARHLEALAQVWLLVFSQRNPVPSETDLQEKAPDTEAALARVLESGFFEAQWRVEAEAGHEERAISFLEAARDELKKAGLEDTLLEGREVLEVYRRRADLLTEGGLLSQRTAFLEAASWLPLTQIYRLPE